MGIPKQSSISNYYSVAKSLKTFASKYVDIFLCHIVINKRELDLSKLNNKFEFLIAQMSALKDEITNQIPITVEQH